MEIKGSLIQQVLQVKKLRLKQARDFLKADLEVEPGPEAELSQLLFSRNPFSESFTGA